MPEVAIGLFFTAILTGGIAGMAFDAFDRLRLAAALGIVTVLLLLGAIWWAVFTW